MSDAIEEFLTEVEEGERQGRFRTVFWMCPKGCRGLVDWSKNDDGLSVPKCRECGEEGKPR